MIDKRESMDIPAQGRTIGEYRFLKEAGRGGFGITYLVEGPGNVIYIVKELYPVSYAQFYERNADGLLVGTGVVEERHKQALYKAVEQELAMSDMINRDNTGNIDVENTNSPYIFRSERLDFPSVETDVPYIKIATTSGHTLKEDVEWGMSIIDALHITKKIYKALTQGLHNRNVVHGDLKFENVYATGDSVKIMDFGASYVMGSYSKERLLSDNAFSYSEVYASPRIKNLCDALRELGRCNAMGSSGEEIDIKLEKAYDEVNELSAYEDLYAVFVMLFYMMFGCYPFCESLEDMDAMLDFIKFQDMNIMTKRLVYVMAEALYNENVQLVEEGFGNWIDSMISSATPGMELYELGDYAKTCKEEFGAITKSFDKRYTSGRLDDIKISQHGAYEYAEGSVRDYDELIEGMKSANTVKKTYIITGDTEIGKTSFCKSLVCELYSDFIIQGIIPQYYEILTDKLYKKLKDKAKKPCWFKTFYIIQNTELPLQDIDKLYEEGFVLVEVGNRENIDLDYCYHNNVTICDYFFRVEALKEDADRYSEVLDDRVNLDDEFYRNPYIATSIKEEFAKTGHVITSKRLLSEKRINFKLSKYEDMKNLLDETALGFAHQRLTTDGIIRDPKETCKQLVDCHLMVKDKNYEENKTIRFVDGYYGPYYVARAITDKFSNNQPPMKLKCTNKEIEMLASFVDENEKLGFEALCGFISGGYESKEYAFNLVNLYRYSQTTDSICIKNVDFRGVWELERYLMNLDKKIVFENCIFSRECFSCDDSIMRLDGENSSYSYVGNEWKHEEKTFLKHNYKWIKPVMYDGDIYQIYGDRLTHNVMASQTIVIGYEKKDGKNDLRKPITRVISVRAYGLNKRISGTIIDYSVSDKIYCLMENNGKNYYSTYKEKDDDNWKNKWIPTSFPNLKPVSIEVNEGLILIGYGSEEDYTLIKSLQYPGQSKRYSKIRKLSYGYLEAGKVNGWLVLNEEFEAKNFFTINNGHRYIVVCTQNELIFYRCEGKELKLDKRVKVDEYDYCISDGKDTIVIGRGSSCSLEVFDCSNINNLGKKKIYLGTHYDPYSLGWVYGQYKECYVSTVNNSKVGHCIDWIGKHAVYKNRVSTLRPNWFRYEYHSCTFYESIISQRKDYTFFLSMLSECLDSTENLYSDKMKYAIRGLLGDDRLELDEAGVLELITYAYIGLKDKMLYENLLQSYSDNLDCEIKKAFVDNNLSFIIQRLIDYISNLSCEDIVNFKYIWINNVILGVLNKSKDDLDKGGILYSLSKVIYEEFQSKKKVVSMVESDRYFNLAKELCCVAKELGNKMAARTWNEYKLYGEGKTRTLLYY